MSLHACFSHDRSVSPLESCCCCSFCPAAAAEADFDISLLLMTFSPRVFADFFVQDSQKITLKIFSWDTKHSVSLNNMNSPEQSFQEGFHKRIKPPKIQSKNDHFYRLDRSEDNKFCKWCIWRWDNCFRNLHPSMLLSLEKKWRIGRVGP